MFRSWPAALFSAWVVVTPILSGCVTVPQDSSASQSKPVATGQTQSAAPALATSAPALPAVEYTIYQGHYTCAQGRTALTLKINMTGNVADAVFDFKTQRDIRGAFAMQGTFDGKTRKIRLQGKNWINQPKNFSTVNLLGTFNADRSWLSGQVIGNSCSTFEVRKTGVSSATTPTGSQRVTLDLASIRKSAGLVPSFDIVYGGDHLYAAFGTHGTVYVRGITRDYSGAVSLRRCRFNNIAGCLEVLVPGIKLQETGVGWGGKNAGEVSSPTSRYEFSYSGSRDSKNIYVNYTNRQDKVAAHQQARQDFLKNYSIKVLGSRQSGERAIKDAHMLASYAGSCRDMFRKISITPAKGARPGPMKIMVRWSLQRTYEPLHLEEKGDPVHIERTYTLNAQNKYSVTEEVKYECVETSLRVHTAAFSLLGRLMGMSKEKTGFDTALTGTKFGFDVIQVEAQ